MAVMVDKETKESAPVTAFLNADRLAQGRGARSTTRRAASGCRSSAWRWRCARNYDPFKSPTHFKLTDMLKKFDKTFGATGKNYGKVGKDRTMDDIEKRRRDRWNFLFIAGMWFQDLFNYDFRRTEQCIIPYATQEGEISFCAYNTGVGWRNIIEKMHMTATLTKWYEEHGRHEIFAGGKNVPLHEHGPLAGAARRHRDQRSPARSRSTWASPRRRAKKRSAPATPSMKQEAENARMAKLYREHVLKEQPAPGLVQHRAASRRLRSPLPKPKVEEREEVGSFGD